MWFLSPRPASPHTSPHLGVAVRVHQVGRVDLKVETGVDGLDVVV